MNTPKDPVRTFVAVLLDEPTRSALGKLITDLRPLLRGVKWVDPSRLHLTLRFLGDVERQQIADLKNAMEEASHEIASFSVELRGLGTFPPSVPRARVLWSGVGEGAEQLKTVAANVESRLFAHGFGRADRPFSPHLTLARVRDRIDPAGARVLSQKIEASTQALFGRFDVDRIALMASDLRPTGPIYSILEEVRLAARPGSDS